MQFNEFDRVARAKNGDRQAFGELALQYRKNIYGLAFRLTGNLQDAEDITQNVFIQAYLALAKFTPNHDGSLKSWLLTITSNLCIDYMRRNYRRKIYTPGIGYHELDWVASGENTLDIITAAEDKRILREALLRLPPKYRMAIGLKYIEELNYQEISQIMHIPMGTVGTLIQRGLKKLRAELNNKGVNENGTLAVR